MLESVDFLDWTYKVSEGGEPRLDAHLLEPAPTIMTQGEIAIHNISRRVVF